MRNLPNDETRFLEVASKRTWRCSIFWPIFGVLFCYLYHQEWGYTESIKDLQYDLNTPITLPQIVIATPWSLMDLDNYQSRNGLDQHLNGDPSYARLVNRAKCKINGFKTISGGSRECATSGIVNDTTLNSLGGFLFNGYSKTARLEDWQLRNRTEFLLVQVYYYFNSNVSRTWMEGAQSNGPTALLGIYSAGVDTEDLVELQLSMRRFPTNALNFIDISRTVVEIRPVKWKPWYTESSDQWTFKLSSTPVYEMSNCDLARPGYHLNCITSLEIRFESDQYLHRIAINPLLAPIAILYTIWTFLLFFSGFLDQNTRTKFDDSWPAWKWKVDLFDSLKKVPSKIRTWVCR